MSPNGMLIGFYAVSAVCIVLLLVRYFARRRRERQNIEQIQTRHRQTQQERPADVNEPAGKPSSPETAPAAAVSPVSPPRASVSASQPSETPRTMPGFDENDYAFGPMTPTLAALLPETENRRRETQKELVQAGYYQSCAYENLSATRYLGIMVAFMVFGTLLIVSPRAWEPVVLTLLIGVPFLAWSLPRLYIKSKAKERKTRLEHAMPDLLDMLNMCVSQGLTVTQSLNRIREDLASVYPDMAQELCILCEQAEIGTLPQAMENFRHRVDVPEVHSFATLILQTERMGTSVSDALTEHSDNMRESMRQRTDEKANRASFSLMFPTVFCLMPAVLMFLIGPAVIELSNFFNSEYANTLNTQTEMIEEIRIDRTRP